MTQQHTPSQNAAYLGLPTTDELVRSLADELTARSLRLSTAESCTGGLIAAACTERAGSSAWFDGGAVTYANSAKHKLLNVPEQLLEHEGAVSEAVVRAMAGGAQHCFATECAIAVSGIAGPDGGTAEKPVGTVWVGIAYGQRITAHKCMFSGNRHAIREATVRFALHALLEML